MAYVQIKRGMERSGSRLWRCVAVNWRCAGAVLLSFAAAGCVGVGVAGARGPNDNSAAGANTANSNAANSNENDPAPPPPANLNAQLVVEGREPVLFRSGDARSEIRVGEVPDPATGEPNAAFRLLLRRVDDGELSQIGTVVDDVALLNGGVIDAAALAGLLQVIVPGDDGESLVLTAGTSTVFTDASANATATGTLTLRLARSAAFTGEFNFTLTSISDVGTVVQAIGDCIDVPPTFDQIGDFDSAAQPAFPVVVEP